MSDCDNCAFDSEPHWYRVEKKTQSFPFSRIGNYAAEVLGGGGYHRHSLVYSQSCVGRLWGYRRLYDWRMQHCDVVELWRVCFWSEVGGGYVQSVIQSARPGFTLHFVSLGTRKQTTNTQCIQLLDCPNTTEPGHHIAMKQLMNELQTSTWQIDDSFHDHDGTNDNCS